MKETLNKIYVRFCVCFDRTILSIDVQLSMVSFTPAFTHCKCNPLPRSLAPAPQEKDYMTMQSFSLSRDLPEDCETPKLLLVGGLVKGGLG